MKSMALICLVMAGSGATTLAQGADVPNPAEVFVRDAYVSGTGCPAGSVHLTLSAGGSQLSTELEEFVAQIGPTIDRLERRKSCNLTVDLHVPAGYAFAVKRIRQEGWASLDPLVWGTRQVNLRFAGDPLTRSVSFQSDFYGPLYEDLGDDLSVGVESLLWSRCGAGVPLVLSTTLTVNSQAEAEGSLAITRSELAELVFKKCGADQPAPPPNVPGQKSPAQQSNQQPSNKQQTQQH